MTQDDLLSARTSPDESGPRKADNVEEVDGRYRGRPVFSFGPCASRRATVSRGTPRRSFDTMGLHEKDSPRSPPIRPKVLLDCLETEVVDLVELTKSGQVRDAEAGVSPVAASRIGV